ncbi:anhydro-N-acetylmuramic acid kinase [Fulvivirga sediminis]|uniref:Anhydro-N-acetylmuramic acid kinase n=1 Tax=Fulvivirga sediminis TaxID=2803949 RepID=A0A937F8K8_9BACT|nr:anhydro-N-acetylmuramic acid kinase [Fulvivirga sediminis]MBL3657007.1 anhydro-N-acetylmuramic acid kinase [Fulvivirga sediminis]
MKNKTQFNVIGLMSGTSLDGLDIAYCHFRLDDQQWGFKIIHAETVEYPLEMIEKLMKSTTLSGLQLTQLDHELGSYIGNAVHRFVNKYQVEVDLIASHGHTVFHQPEKGFTLQIGNINDISAKTGLPVIGDFRSLDVAYGGQGAPLVPIGDKLLFSDYDYCLNLGGIANISYENNGQRIAFDISPCNMVLNHLAARLGKSYDHEGGFARSGHVDKELLKQFNNLPFYASPAPKSLGFEWVERNFFPLLEPGQQSTEDLLATCVEHFAFQISRTISKPGSRLLITGGGTFNNYLIERITSHSGGRNTEVIIPDKEVIGFKEALIFAFLGVLKITGQSNCMSSVTGASQNTCGGVSVGFM